MTREEDESGKYCEEVMSVIRTHRWEIFFLHLDDVYTKVVRRFYAHITTLENAFVYVRGK